MNTPVSSELAKLLKEKRFDVPVRNYRLEGKYSDFVHEGFEDDYWGDYRIVNWNKEIIGIKPFKGFVSAPTIAEVVMWLYEKHGIWIFVFRYSKEWQWKVDDENSTLEFSRKGFNSPTEAYEAAINHTLNNLI
jgi:hypothetical protein